MHYRTIRQEAQDEFVERRSRFIGYAMPVTTQEQAIEFINQIKSKHWDATHNCYAYVLRDGQIRRYSDDGEPQGTAGVPMLEVLLKENLTDVCVVATRYFGGILLGAGGLVRAYSKSAKVAIDAAGYVVYTMCDEAVIRCDYNQYGRVNALIPQNEGTITDTQFGAEVEISFIIAPENVAKLKTMLADATCGQCEVEIIGSRFAEL